MRVHRRLAGVLPALALLGTVAAGCSHDGSATGPQPPPSGAGSSDGSVHELKISVQGDTITPEAEQLDLSVGDTLAMTVTADRAGVLHVHSSPPQEFDFGPGTHTYRVSFDKPGRVDIEEHVSDTLIARAVVEQ
jgi:hypothetical protein